MENFGQWQCMSGLTFAHKQGKIDNLATIAKNQWRQLHKDIKLTRERIEEYDLIISDFDPITAWAAKLSGKTCLGIGHQYAFNYPIPKSRGNIISRSIMRNFAPVTLGLGLHWHHFNQPILPPIIDTSHYGCGGCDSEAAILVYLGFESQQDVTALLSPFRDTQFIVYGPFDPGCIDEHITYKAASREGFMKDLAQSKGVICNAGFELVSEAISLGKKVIVKPLQGQMEQASNATALATLNLGTTMPKLCSQTLAQWLQTEQTNKVNYPDVAKHIANWLYSAEWENKNKGGLPCTRDLIHTLWKNTESVNSPYFGSVPAYPGPG